MRKWLLFFFFFMPCVAVEQNPRFLEQNNLTVVDVMTLDPSFSTFITALNVANLTYVLENNEDFTVFAPNNDAFDALPSWKEFLRPENISQLQALLKYHVIPKKLSSNGFRDEEIKTLNGKEVCIKTVDKKITVNEAQISLPGKRAINGVVYGINKVLLPN